MDTDGDEDEELNLLTLAKGVAGAYLRTHSRLMRDADDILSDACWGAASAAARHDPAKGASLRTFAFRRATGAVLDGVRDRSPIGRHEYARTGDWDEAVRRSPLSLEQLTEDGWDPASSPGARMVFHARPAQPEPLILYREEIHHLGIAIRALPEQHREVISRNYFGGETLTAIAADMQLTLGRVSQIRARAEELLKAGMNAAWNCRPTLPQGGVRARNEERDYVARVLANCKRGASA